MNNAEARLDDPKFEIIEEMVKKNNLTAPRVTYAQVEDAIVGETYTVLPSGKVMVCELTLRNGFTVRGEGSAVSKANFNEEVGKKVSRAKAVDQVWAFLGYQLQEKLHRDSMNVDGNPETASRSVEVHS